MSKILIKNGKVVSDNTIKELDILVENQFIVKIGKDLSDSNAKIIDATGKHIIPGIIDDQVHFREPGLTHKANIYTESKAAVAGGVTSYMEMPNTKPAALSLELLEDKYNIASRDSLANYSFYMGTSNDNPDIALSINTKEVCGIKIFMGSSTGNMLVDNPQTLEKIFCNSDVPVAIHSEDEETIAKNTKQFIDKYGDNIPFSAHPDIRSREACEICTIRAIDIAKSCNGRLHILHISTADELKYFTNAIPLKDKRITSEVCVHHLYFESKDYNEYGSLIKCNPAIKLKSDKDALFEALLDDRLDIIATDHAPHTWQEKQSPYLSAPSGVPLIQHTLNIMLDFYHQGRISLEKIVDKMCHKPAEMFQIEKRGHIQEGFYADLAIVDIDKIWEVNKFNIYYKCAWSPFEGKQIKGYITDTIVSGHHAYSNGKFDESKKGERLKFERE
jgi:dihydroorotase